MKKKSKASSGAVSGILLILGVVLLVVIIVVFIVIKISAGKTASTTKSTTTTTTTQEPPAPIYNTTIGNVKFIFQSATDLGSVLQSKNAYGQNLTTTEKFIEVVIGAQNKGKVDTVSNLWDVGNIVDSDGRNFISINNQAYGHLPQPNPCGAILKPEFTPTSCVKLYEVSKESKGLKVQVGTGQGAKQQALLDLNVQ